MKLDADVIKKYASEAGFALCGVARARVLAEHAPRFAAGLEASGDRALRYLADRPERRFDPSLHVPGAQTVAVCAVDYRNRRSEGYPDGFPCPKVCSYALSTEYQPKIKAMLAGVLERLKGDCPRVTGRVFCDTSAILEKAWAVEAGLGWIGRNSLLVNPVYGSFVLLGEIVLTAGCDSYDAPYEGPGCGECRRCVEACPASAIPRDRTIDTRRCISALTIEKAGSLPAPASLHGWIYGCDECQSVCPYNRGATECGGQNRPADGRDGLFAGRDHGTARRDPSFGPGPGASSAPSFDPVFDPADFPAGRWRTMTDGEFNAVFAGTPLLRTGLERIKKTLP